MFKIVATGAAERREQFAAFGDQGGVDAKVRASLGLYLALYQVVRDILGFPVGQI